MNRSQAGAIGAEISWANTQDRSARTAPARAAADAKFVEEARRLHPDGPDEKVAEAAEHLRRAHFKRLAQKSAESRAKNAAPKAAQRARGATALAIVHDLAASSPVVDYGGPACSLCDAVDERAEHVEQHDIACPYRRAVELMGEQKGFASAEHAAAIIASERNAHEALRRIAFDACERAAVIGPPSLLPRSPLMKETKDEPSA